MEKGSDLNNFQEINPAEKTKADQSFISELSEKFIKLNQPFYEANRTELEEIQQSIVRLPEIYEGIGDDIDSLKNYETMIYLLYKFFRDQKMTRDCHKKNNPKNAGEGTDELFISIYNQARSFHKRGYEDRMSEKCRDLLQDNLSLTKEESQQFNSEASKYDLRDLFRILLAIREANDSMFKIKELIFTEYKPNKSTNKNKEEEQPRTHREFEVIFQCSIPGMEWKEIKFSNTGVYPFSVKQKDGSWCNIGDMEHYMQPDWKKGDQNSMSWHIKEYDCILKNISNDFRETKLWNEKMKKNWQDPELVEKAIDWSNRLRKTGSIVLEPGAEFTLGYSHLSKKVSGLLDKVLKDKPLLDLGAGYSRNMSHLSRVSGASKYTAVDLLNPMKFKTNEQGEIVRDDYYDDEEKTKKRHEGEQFFQEDMLRYVSKLPDNSCNIVVNGIDSCIAGASAYIDLLCKHIERVARNGVVFGINSRPIFSRLKELGFKEMSGEDNNLLLQIYQKKEGDDDSLSERIIPTVSHFTAKKS